MDRLIVSIRRKGSVRTAPSDSDVLVRKIPEPKLREKDMVCNFRHILSTVLYFSLNLYVLIFSADHAAPQQV